MSAFRIMRYTQTRNSHTFNLTRNITSDLPSQYISFAFQIVRHT